MSIFCPYSCTTVELSTEFWLTMLLLQSFADTILTSTAADEKLTVNLIFGSLNVNFFLYGCFEDYL